jgi:hypothetical protein
MAARGLTLDIKAETKELQALIKSFPELRARIFSYIGKHGRLTLKNQLLRGQELFLNEYPKDKKGRPTISHHVLPRAVGVQFSSYPLNLYENKWSPHGVRKGGRKILTGKFKIIMESKLQEMATEARRKIIDGELSKV